MTFLFHSVSPWDLESALWDSFQGLSSQQLLFSGVTSPSAAMVWRFWPPTATSPWTPPLSSAGASTCSTTPASTRWTSPSLVLVFPVLLTIFLIQASKNNPYVLQHRLNPELEVLVDGTTYGNDSRLHIFFSSVNIFLVNQSNHFLFNWSILT